MKNILAAFVLLSPAAFALDDFAPVNPPSNTLPVTSLALEATVPATAVKKPATVWFGHNLSQSTAVLSHGECTAGLQIVACGAFDRVTIGSSPFIWSTYELPNLFLRFGDAKDGSGYGRFAIQAAHVGAAQDRDEGYVMSVSSLWLIGKVYQTPTSSIFFNGIVAYYWDDTVPYSLRRPQPNPTPLQVSTTVAFTAKIAPFLHLNAETGILGLNEDFPHLHTGATLGFSGGRFAGHIGLSFDSTYEALWASEKADRWSQRKGDVHSARYAAKQGWETNPNAGTISSAEAASDLGFHPEVALQLFF